MTHLACNLCGYHYHSKRKAVDHVFKTHPECKIAALIGIGFITEEEIQAYILYKFIGEMAPMVANFVEKKTIEKENKRQTEEDEELK